MKKNQKLNRRKCMLIGIIFVVCIILLLFKFLKNNNKELTVMLDSVILELINKPIVDDDTNVYLSKEDIKNLFDNTIFYNELDKEIITTYNKHIAALKVDEKSVDINDEKIELNATLKLENGIVYLPISELSEVYDLEIYYSNNTNRVIMDSINKRKVEAEVKQRTSLKEGKGIFSGKIETLIIGDRVVILEDLGMYKKVRTKDGNIGFVRFTKLYDEETIREDNIKSSLELTPYFNYSNSAGIYDDVEVDLSKRNVVLPEFFSIDKNGKLLDKVNISTATYSVYKNWTEKNNFEILPTLSNNSNVSDTLLSYSKRSKIINELREKILEYNYFGINISFKTIDDFNSFYRFIVELAPRFREKDLKVIITINNNNIDRQKVEKIVDCIIEE